MLRPIVSITLAALLLPLAATAHRSWLLPSSTVLSGQDPWITVDAAVSNDLFYFDHNPGRLNGLAVTAPNGSSVAAENQFTGKYRSSFDVHLTQQGTYKIAVVNEGVMASYTENGETKRWRGTQEQLTKEVPASAQDLRVTRSLSRQEVFVTSGNPTQTVFTTTGKGIELQPITHPNDLFAKETARLRFLLDGKPGANLKVTVIRGGIRYRTALEEMNLTTDAKGEVQVTWPEAGMYWVSVSSGEGRRTPGEGEQTNVAPAQNRGNGGGGGGGVSSSSVGNENGNGGNAVPNRRVSYSMTVEVLPQ